MFDFLNAANPFNWLKTILIWFGILAIGLLIGGIGGCNYKQAQWDADKVRQMENSKKLEKKDAVAGSENTREYRAESDKAKEGSDFVKRRLDEPGKVKLAKVVTRKAPAQEQVNCPTPSISNTQPKVEETSHEDETAVVELTADFSLLYDVSVKPGDPELRSGTYKAPTGATLDEGFKKVIEKNNEQYAACRLQLNKLLDRIEQKQQIFTQD